jgi:N-acetylmuramoyl-L-alanine amidase
MIKYLVRAKNIGIIHGQTDMNGNLIFRPNDSITRAEAAKILVSVKRLILAKTGNTAFGDVDNSSELAVYIKTAHEAKIFSGQTIDGKLIFRPNDSITRAEAAKVIISAE